MVEVVHRLRDGVLTEMPRAHEFVWDATNTVSLVYTPTTRWQDGVCHIAAYAKHANLGFNNGAAIADPLGLLQGTGSKIRHITFHAVDDTTAPWIIDYVRAAMAHAGVTATDGDGGTTIRRSAGPRRRPGRNRAG